MGGGLNSVSSRYFSCSTSGWLGISISGNGTLHFESNHVEDALTGVEILSSAAQITLLSNYFNRNATDIYVGLNVAANAVVVGNTFECTSNNFQNTNSDNGIVANKLSTISIGSPQPATSLLTNTIRYHKYGSSSFRANLTFRNTNFECNTYWGITSTFGSLDVRGTNTKKSNFLNNRYDIVAENTALDIRNCDFRGCITHNIISSNNLNNPQINIGGALNTIERNLFTISNGSSTDLYKTGIWIDRPSGGGTNHSISQNDFIIEAFDSEKERRAIKVTGYTGTQGSLELRSNNVLMFQGGGNPAGNKVSSPFELTVGPAPNYLYRFNGISTRNLGSATSYDFGNRWGFYVHDWEAPSSGNHFEQNTIFGDDAEFDYGMCAFHFSNSGPWNMCENITNNTFRGFHFNFNCATSVFGGNRIGEHKRPPIVGADKTAGLLMENGSKIGVQGEDTNGFPICRHNHFTNADYAPDAGAWHKGSFNNVSQSKFYYSLGSDELPNPIQSGSTWFYQTSCGDPTGHCGAEGPKYTESFSILEKNSLSSFSSGNLTVEEWETQQDLVTKMLFYPALKSLSTDAGVFFSDRENTSPGKFAQFKQLHHEAMLMPSNLEASITQVRNAIVAENSSLVALDGTLQTIYDYQHIPNTFFTARAQILGNLNSLQQQEDGLIELIEAERKIKLDNCALFLAGLPQNTPYEINQVTLNALALKKSRGIDFDATDYNLLHNIAAQCPQHAGRTREKAIDYLPSGDAYKIQTDIPTEIPCGRENKSEQYSTTTNTIPVKIAPNPAINTVSLSFDKVFEGTVAVISPLGTAVFEQQVSGAQVYQINLPELPSGNYFIRLQGNDGSSKVERLSIIR
jgi:Secretion system C-terminal sorting domain